MNKLLLRFLLTTFLLSSISAFAQKASWAIRFGDNNDQHVMDIRTDKNENVIVGGKFAGRADFDPSPTDSAILTSAGSDDFFLAKYTKDGQYIWAFSVGKIDNDAVEKIRLDDSGNIYVSGYFKGIVDFDPSPTSSANLNGPGGSNPWGVDAFLAKYSPDGKYKWAFALNSSASGASGRDIAFDMAGNIIWTGSFSGYADFDPSAATSILIAPFNSSVFIAKYTPSGQFRWARQIGGNPNTCIASSMKIDSSGNIYLSGYFDNTIDLDPDPAVTHNITTKGSTDFFLVKWDSAAHYQWGFNIGGVYYDYSFAMDIDENNNLYLTGYYQHVVDFDPGPDTLSLGSQWSGKRGFLAKYDQNGHYVFAKEFSSAIDATGYGIAVNPSGLTVTGSFEAGVGFGGWASLYSQGGTDVFIVRYDLDGNFRNAFRVGGTLDEKPGCINTTYDILNGAVYKENIIIGGYFKSITADFDPSSPKLLLSSAGGYDAFVAKYENVEVTNKIKGTVFLDNNKNGYKEASEPFFDWAKVTVTKPGVDTIVTMSWYGEFSVPVDTGTYTTTVEPYEKYFTVAPQSFSSTFNGFDLTDYANFAVQPIPGIRDLSVHIYPSNVARPGFPAVAHVGYQNSGTATIANTVVEYIKDSRVSIDSTNPAASYTSGDTLRWNIGSMAPSSFDWIYIYQKNAAPPTLQIGDSLILTAKIYPVVGDSTPADNVSRFVQRVVGSYDPNDKTEMHGGRISTVQLSEGDYLNYMIRFQNTGTDTAFNIALADTLSDRLDWTTIQMIASSHNYKLSIKDGRICKWQFDNINLLDSFTNEPASHGYIVFRIKPRANLAVGDVISNQAAIYFDYNPPVMTNTELTTVMQALLPLKMIAFNAVKSGPKNLLDWTTVNEENTASFEVQRSRNGRDFLPMGKVAAAGYSNLTKRYTAFDEAPGKVVNYYRLKMLDRDGRFSYSPIRKVDNSVALDISIFPNPVKDNLYIKTGSETSTTATIEVINADGKVVLLRNVVVDAGSSTKTLNVAGLASGSYFMHFRSGSELTSLKFQKL